MNQPVEPQKEPDDLDQQVIDLHALGVGRNAAARRLQITNYRVDKIAAEHGLSFDAAATAQAVEVVAVNARAQRQQLAARYRALAARALDEADLQDNPDLLWSWLKAAATATDKDLAIAAREPSDHGTGGEAVTALKAFFRTSLGRDE